MIRKPLFVLLFSLVGLTSPSHLEARALGKISKDQINIKGKTTEKLGVIGKEKAIASEAIVSIIKHD